VEWSLSWKPQGLVSSKQVREQPLIW
jgi:hypothetical protein